MKTSLIALLGLCLLLCVHSAKAQSGVVASGGDATGVGGSASYSVGQVGYTVATGTTGSVWAGVQQPYEISIISGIEETGIGLDLNVFPNPYSEFIVISVENADARDLDSRLVDLQGRVLDEGAVSGNKTEIDLARFSDSAYILTISANQQIIKSTTSIPANLTSI